MLGRIYPLALLLVFADVVMKASCTEKGSLAFVIDDNTSMRKDVDQIKNNLNEIKDIVFNGKSSVISNIVLVTFNSSVAHVKPVAGNRDDFEKALKEVYPSSTLSSVDCQELTIHALTTALKESNPGSYIFVFTDTFAKDFEDADVVKDLCQEKQSQISFVSTEKPCSLGDDWVDKLKDVYSEIAQACSGLAYEINKDAVSEVLTPISNIISGETIIITATTVPAGVSKNIPFDVDDQIEYVLVSVSGKTVTIDISGHNGRQENLMWNDNAKVVKLMNVKYGKYTATVKGKSELSVNVIGRTDFVIKHGFSKLKPDSINDTSLQPQFDTDIHFLSILVTDERQTVEIRTAQILGMDGTPLKPDIPLTKISKDFYITQPLVTPTQRFKVAVSGKVKATGHVVKRFAKIPITTSKPPKLPDDKFLKVVIAEGNETSVEYNSSLTLTCKVSASPEPKIFWHNNKGRQMFSKVTKTNGSSSDYISYLNIHVTANDGYICHAINTAGTNKATIKVKVKDAFTVADTFLNVKVDYGKPGVLKCDIKSRFPMKTNWYLVNEISGEKDRIIDSDDYSLSADKTELTIKKMDFNLVGKYICHAYLINDRAIKTAISRRVKISGLVLPKVQIEPIVKAVRGVTALLECNVTGVPVPTIKWHFGGKSGSKFVLLNETGSVLRINNAEAKHEGQYKCVAENAQAYKDEKITTLIVQDIPRILSRRSIIRQAVEGDDILKIPCVAVGDPRPTITWKMDGRPIEVPNNKYTVEDGALIIKYPKIADTKSYVCVAKNMAGSETATFKAVVRRNSQLPGVAPQTVDMEMSFDKKCSATSRVETSWFANIRNNRPNDVCNAYCEEKKRAPLKVCNEKKAKNL